mmetsp:Transcript_12709/g.37113  ORF Transcript_12709/g.37113 Transcript_12709/m.37113 type:complete len:111 (+) Transcript_12709:310-642(+)
MAFRTVTYGVTADNQTGFSANLESPQMTSLQQTRATEMWANNKEPWAVTYAPHGVTIYPMDDPTPWKRRNFDVAPPMFEGTRFRATQKELVDRTVTLSTLQTQRRHAGWN